jgi:RecA/RadA recombinase
VAKLAVKIKNKNTTKIKAKDKINNFTVRVYSNILDEVENKFDLSAGEASKYRLSSGLLMVDWICSGGLVAGMTTVAGPEQSGKSTLTMGAIYSGIQAGIPIIGHFDAEGTAQSDPDYAAAIYRVKSLDEIYGKRINNEWQIIPKVRYWDTTILEKYFNSMVRMLSGLPDKMYNRETDQWYLRIALTGTLAKRQAQFLKIGDIDDKLSNKNFAWIATDNVYPQALIVPDSYVTFLSEDVEEKEEMGGGLAAQARDFALHLKRVVGKFRRKQVAVFGTNQLRERPGMVMGPRIYEPGGNALKLYSSVRLAATPRAAPDKWRHDKKISQFSTEPSVEGAGEDAYAWKHIKNTKNKTGTPWQECWTRVWIRDCESRGRGFDVVYDTATFLITIGLAREGQRHKIEFIKSDLHALSGKTLTWFEFKTLIIAEEYKSPMAVANAKKLINKLGRGKDIKLRQWCFNLLRTGKAMELSNANNNAMRERRKAKPLRDLEAD